MKKFLQINRMKSKFAFLTGLLLFFSITASAYNFELDGIFYNIEQGVKNQVSVTSGNYRYEGDIVIPSSVNYNNTDYSVTSIGDYAFYECSSLVSIDLPGSLTSIRDQAFEGCSSLVSIDLPDSLTSIGDWAFYGCSSLVSMDLPDSLTSIGVGAFGNCSSLVSIDLPDSLTYIGIWAFISCSSLTSIDLLDSLTSIGNSVFLDCSSLVRIDLPDSLTSIEEYAFWGCSSLVSIDFPDSLISIGNQAFLGCSSLISIDLPDSLTSIGDDAFLGCSSLTSIDLPDSLTSIGDSAFLGCSSLKYVTCRAIVVPELGSYVFTDISKEAILYVYESVLEDYENSDWAQYFSEIIPMEDPVVEVTSIKISPEGEQEMTEGATMVFTATVLPENATDTAVVWTVDNEEVISIEVSDEDPNMVSVTALETGEATLTATAADGSGVTAQVSIIVKAPQTPVTPATKVEITGFYGSILYLGSSVTLSAIVSPEDATYKEVIWETSNPEVLTVDEEGYVSAVGLGTAKISVAVASDLTVSDSIEITVMEDSQSGIAGITPDADGLYKVYSMAGNLVLSTKDPSKIKDLENGLYIINGKKVLLRQD